MIVGKRQKKTTKLENYSQVDLNSLDFSTSYTIVIKGTKYWVAKARNMCKIFSLVPLSPEKTEIQAEQGLSSQ